MNNKILGALGMIGAPFLFLAAFPGSPWYSNTTDTSLQGVFELIYMLGWMCSIAGLKQLRATGSKRWGRIVLVLQFVFLTLANSWNVWNIFQLDTNNALYQILDLTWPLSNVWMLVMAITIAVVNRLEGWRRWVPLLVGLWLPFSLLLILGVGKNDTTMLLSGIYSALAWFLLGYMIWATPIGAFSNKELVIT